MIHADDLPATTLRRLDSFLRRCDGYAQQALKLAMHAAVPVVLNPDLVHLLRINFFLDPPETVPYTAESDLLLSPMCRELGEGMYEIYPEVRQHLLEQLAQRFGAARTRDIATLLWNYVVHRGPWSDQVELERAQLLTALCFLDSDRATGWLQEAEASASGRPTVERAWVVAMRADLARVLQARGAEVQTDFRLRPGLAALIRPTVEALGLRLGETAAGDFFLSVIDGPRGTLPVAFVAAPLFGTPRLDALIQATRERGFARTVLVAEFLENQSSDLAAQDVIEVPVNFEDVVWLKILERAMGQPAADRAQALAELLGLEPLRAGVSVNAGEDLTRTEYESATTDIEAFLRAARFETAVATIDELLSKIIRRVEGAPLGPNSLEHANVLALGAEALLGEERLPQMEELARQAFEIVSVLPSSNAAEGLGARSSYLLGVAALRLARLDEADEWFGVSLLWAERGGFELRRTAALRARAEVASARGDLARARYLLEQSIASSAAEGDRSGELAALWRIGEIAQGQDLFDQAESRYREAAFLSEAMLDKVALVLSLRGLARAIEAQGRWADALAAYERCVILQQELGLEEQLQQDQQCILRLRDRIGRSRDLSKMAPLSFDDELPRVEVQLFNAFVLHRNGQLIQSTSRKINRAGELAALLILNPQGLSDETIAGKMFPDMPEQTALQNLQMAAYALRRDLDSSAAIRYGAHMYQLSPELELVADVREFDAALAASHGASRDALVQALSRAIDLYKGPLLPAAGWDWVEPVRLDYQQKFVAAAVQLADVMAQSDLDRSDAIAEQALAAAPETYLAYERLLLNAMARRDPQAINRIRVRYERAARRFGFAVNPHLAPAPASDAPAAARMGTADNHDGIGMSIDLSRLPNVHPGLTPTIAEMMAEAAAVALSRFHSSPTVVSLTVRGEEELNCSLYWESPNARQITAWKNSVELVEPASTGIALAIVFSAFRLVAFARAPTKTGVDYFLRRVETVDQDPADIDVNDVVALDVSGTLSTMSVNALRQRLAVHLDNMKRGGSTAQAALAMVVDIPRARVLAEGIGNWRDA